MSYYYFNNKKKRKKEKAVEYYSQNKEAIKENLNTELESTLESDSDSE